MIEKDTSTNKLQELGTDKEPKFRKPQSEVIDKNLRKIEYEYPVHYLFLVDFCLSTHINSIIYETPVVNEEDLLGKILAACDLIRTSLGILERMRQSYHDCIDVGGCHFEHLL